MCDVKLKRQNNDSHARTPSPPLFTATLTNPSPAQLGLHQLSGIFDVVIRYRLSLFARLRVIAQGEPNRT